jgi:mRNA interferase MazF
MMHILRRGDVVRARLDPTEGSEQGGTRPVLVLSPDRYAARANIVLVAPLTSQKTDNIYPHEALIRAGDGPPTQSKALLNQLRVCSKSRITAFYGHVSDETMKEVDAALQIAVGLTKI